MTMDSRVHFLFGMSRAGITWLSRRLNAHPEIAVFGQSRFWGKRFIRPAAPAGYSNPDLRRIHQILRSCEWDATVGDGAGTLRRLDHAGFHALLDEVFARVSAPISPANLFRAIAFAVAEREGKRLAI